MKAKNKICIECGRDDMPWFSKKRCKYCASKSYKKPSNVRKPNADKKIRDMYYETLILLCNTSDESNISIYNPTRANICHIFPKRTYKSIQDNLDNVMFYTLEEHTRFDQLLDTYRFDVLEKEFKNSWQKVLKKVKLLLPLIKENKKLKLKFEEYLLTNKNETK